MRLFPLLLLAWPLAEIAAFVIIGREIGVLATIALILLTAVVGSVLLRTQGFGVLRRVQEDVDAGRNPGREVANGVMILFAGVLLLLPGFLTDIIGILLFLPPVRDWVWRRIKDRVAVVPFPGGMGGGRRGRAQTIDLDPDDYSSANPDGPAGRSGDGDPNSPWRRIDHDR